LAKFRKQKQTADKKPPEKKETPMEFIASMAEIFVIGLFIVTFNFQPFEIPSGSMLNTLLIGDHLLVDRTTPAPPTRWAGPLIPYSDVRRDDIVVFISPVQPGLHVVKRVIGVPGDRIKLVNNQVYRNGQPLEEPYVIPIDPDLHDPFRDDFPAHFTGREPETAAYPEWRVLSRDYIINGELVVPPGRYFAMGDNRRESLDSRYWGFIPRENIIGRPMVIYWSFETPDDQYRKMAMTDRIKWLFHVAWRFLPDTRWKRTFRLVE
jgi:signal peptidase I